MCALPYSEALEIPESQTRNSIRKIPFYAIHRNILTSLDEKLQNESVRVQPPSTAERYKSQLGGRFGQSRRKVEKQNSAGLPCNSGGYREDTVKFKYNCGCGIKYDTKLKTVRDSVTRPD